MFSLYCIHKLNVVTRQVSTKHWSEIPVIVISLFLDNSLPCILKPGNIFNNIIIKRRCFLCFYLVLQFVCSNGGGWIDPLPYKVPKEGTIVLFPALKFWLAPGNLNLKPRIRYPIFSFASWYALDSSRCVSLPTPRCLPAWCWRLRSIWGNRLQSHLSSKSSCSILWSTKLLPCWTGIYW